MRKYWLVRCSLVFGQTLLKKLPNFFEGFFPFFKIFCILWNTPEQVARDRKKCFWYHIFWSGKLLYAWQSQNIGLCILKDPYHFGKKGSLRSCSELPELSVIFSRPIMWLVRIFLLTTNTIWIVVLLVKTNFCLFEYFDVTGKTEKIESL